MIARAAGSAALATCVAVGFAVTTASMSAQTPQTAVAQAPRPTPPQAPAAAAARTTARRAAPVPRTEDGRPNLMGVWGYATITPLERPSALGERAEFSSDAEVQQFEQSNQRRSFDERQPGTRGDVEGAYNDFWWDRGTKAAGRQTSLVIDPPNGRIPAQLPEAQKRIADRQAARPRPAAGIDADNPEDRNLWERCVTRTIPYLSGAYNNNIQIVQTKDHVVVVAEMIHEARIIPTTSGAKHGTVRKWHGDSIGRWEGDTLVVETINFIDKVNFRGSSANLKLTERFSRQDADTLMYEFTVEDPTTWPRPWTVRMPMSFNREGMFEYACHEGNYGLQNIMKGSRQQEKERPSAPPVPAPAAR